MPVPLSPPNAVPAKEQRAVIAQYVEDIGKYEVLRERHLDLQTWVVKQCLSPQSN